jgi:hypothetical protein
MCTLISTPYKDGLLFGIGSWALNVEEIPFTHLCDITLGHNDPAAIVGKYHNS